MRWLTTLIVLLCWPCQSYENAAENVKIVTVQKVKTFGETCLYKGHNFTSTHYPNETCQRWKCENRDNMVEKMECTPLPPDCERDPKTARLEFPLCCRTVCTKRIYLCITPSYQVLKDGESLNSTEPCVRYTCSGGNVTTETCPRSKKNKHKKSRKAKPYPLCCRKTGGKKKRDNNKRKP